MIRTDTLSYQYDAGPGFEFPDIECSAKKQLLILGQSGVGKSTLLHLLGGLMNPTSGGIYIGDKDITKLSGKQMDNFRGNNIGIVFQQNHFIASISVIDNLLFAQALSGNKEDKSRCLDLLSRLNVDHRAQKLPATLSQGERQRVAIARALVNNPKLLLADEPTSALDDENCTEVVKLLQEQASDQDAALVVVTHDGRLKENIPHHILLQKSIQV